MVAVVEVKCKCCKQPFMARVADRNRGWGRFCSKRCKAVKQEQRTGQYSNYIHKNKQADTNYRGSGVDRDTYEYYANEYGGIPQFSRSGVYQGFRMSISDLAHGGYNNAGPNDPFGDGKY